MPKAFRRSIILAAIATLAVPAPAGARPRVLQVGTYHGITGPFATIQAAVNAAKPGDWILVAPGDYHENGTANAGVLVTTPSIHIRGLDRNRVIVDGTKPGAAPCSAQAQDQLLGSSGGRNGIEVLKTDGVTIENLTACNYLSDSYGSGGNEIWWNGGDGSGKIGMGSWYGRYLTASSTYYQANVPNVPLYGLFVSNARGPGALEDSYASNMADSSFYVGACADCNATLRRVHAQNSALGYSGTNAGGHLLIEDSEWDQNIGGIVPSSLAVDDLPSPQDGACPAGDPHKFCTFIRRNFVHDNNNPNAPKALGALSPPVGVGIELTGGRNDTVRDNIVVRNGAWGILVNDYPDPQTSNNPEYCTGGIKNFAPPAPYNQILGSPIPCYFRATGNRIQDNFFAGNGFFGNVTNGDLANLSLPSKRDNCFARNLDRNGMVTTAPANLQDPNVAGTCGRPWNPNTRQEVALIEQVLCDAFGPGTGLCSGPGYPQPTTPVLLPIPKLRGLANPCEGVPSNSWCRAGDVRNRAAGTPRLIE